VLGVLDATAAVFLARRQIDAKTNEVGPFAEVMDQITCLDGVPNGLPLGRGVVIEERGVVIEETVIAPCRVSCAAGGGTRLASGGPVGPYMPVIAPLADPGRAVLVLPRWAFAADPTAPLLPLASHVRQA
jgi:hypothetical protein